ncbi:AlbA family DNA-binding domain-containing protein [Streptomyces sp. enrichment culture]|uniref:AlbA family DNA-binding domain-containing protein n=1 Tax=Streptomyces sp. enrichment culture TaxID=1795815 RepID=UPI003F55DFDF
MALDFDSRKAPRNHSDLLQLVRAVRHASKADEALWLEWKSELDLDPADKGDKSGRAHIARAIIGFANRHPDEARRFAEGHGYLLVGVDHEQMPGVKQHDVTELVRWITPYVGDKIGWMPTYVEAEGENGPVAILVITVDPPQWGDPIHCMRKEAPSPRKSISEAAVFVRAREGETRPAKARDIDALSERLVHRPPSMNLALEVLSGVIRPLSCTEEEIELWLQGEEREALASLESHLAREAQPPTLQSVLSRSISHPLIETPEERTPEQYRLQVQRYLKKCRQKLPAALEEAAAARLTPITLRLLNHESANLEGVQVELYIPGAVQALEVESDWIADNERFPRALPPRPYYGPRSRLPFGAGFSVNSGDLIPRAGDTSINIDNSGSARLQLPPVHLRPNRHADLEPFVVVSSPAETGPVIAEWSVTCTNRDGVESGTVTLPRANALAFYELFAEADNA